MKNKLYLVFQLLAFHAISGGLNGVHKEPRNTIHCDAIDHENTLRPANSFGSIKEKNQSAPSSANATNPVRVNAGSSPNLYTVIFGQANTVSANQNLGIISFVRRRNAEDAGNTGYVQASISLNEGNTFDSTLALVSDEDHYCRYPSGAIFNPPGNTNPNNALIVSCGPVSGWQGNFFASTRLDGSSNHVWFQDNLDPTNVQPMDLVRNNIQSTTDGHVYVSGAEYVNVNGTTAAAQGFIQGVLVKGTYQAAGDSFVWSTRTFPHSFQLDPIDASKKVFGTNLSAWSENGQIGYFIYNGIDSLTSYNTYQPIVYKTMDAGATWNLMPIFNYGTIPSINAFLRPTTSGTKRPFFGMTHGMDAVVDANGELHIVCVIQSASSEDPDSLDYVWDTPLSIFDVHTSGSSWGAFFVDSLLTSDVADANSPWTDGGGIGWGARLNVGRTTDGTKVFYTWLDTDPFNWGGISENLFPDIKGRGYNVSSNLLTPVVNFTSNDIVYNGSNYWLFSSNIDLVKNDSIFVIPSTITNSRVAGDPGTGPVQHKYIKNMEYRLSQFTQTTSETVITYNFKGDETSKLQWAPNPSNGFIRVMDRKIIPEISLVEIFDFIGKKVMQTRMPADGILDVSHFFNGVYYVRCITQNSPGSVARIVLNK